jgi:hypothetical protein
MSAKELKALTGMKKEWRRRARFAFISAESEQNQMGRKLIEHGATCYMNITD